MLSAGVFAEEKSVSGTVVDMDGNPVAGISLYLIDYTPSSIQQYKLIEKTRSDTDGKFLFKNQYNLSSSSQEMIVAYQQGKMLGWLVYKNSQDFNKNIEIKVNEVGSISGKVIDENGHPIEGARVFPQLSYTTMSSIRNVSFLNIYEARDILGIEGCVTDKDGNFELVDVPIYTRSYKAIKKGYETIDCSESNLAFTREQFEKPQRIIMGISGGVTGKVTDSKGDLSQARVAFGRIYNDKYFYSTESSDKGDFEIMDMLPGKYKVSYFENSPYSWLPFSIEEIEVKAGEMLNIGALRKLQTVTFSGTLLDANNKPAANMLLFAAPKEKNFVVSRSTNRIFSTSSTDVKGNYLLKLVPGSYNIGANGIKGNFPRKENFGEIIIPQKGLVNHIIKLKPVKTFNGIVYDSNNNPAANITIDSDFDRTISDKNGKFSLRIRNDEDFIIVSASDGNKSAAALKINIQDYLNKPIILKLQEIKPVKVMVTDYMDKPIADVPVRSSFFSEMYYTDKDGFATLNTIPSGIEETLVVNYRLMNKALKIDADHSKPLYICKFPQEYVISGTVVNSAGLPINNAKVFMGNQDTPLLYTNEKGIFSFETPGIINDGYIWAYSYNNEECGYTKLTSVPIFNKVLKIALMPTQKLTIKVTDLEGKPLQNVLINLNGNQANTNTNGVAVVSGLVNGIKYYISAKLKGYYYIAEGDLPSVGSSDWKSSINLKMITANRTITGKVIDENGKAVDGAQISYEGSDGNSVLSDKNGKFTLTGVPDTEIDIRAYKYEIQGQRSYGSKAISKTQKEVAIILKKI